MATGYLRKAFDPVKVKKLAKETAAIAVKVGADVVVCRGLSGIIVATVVGAIYKIPFAVVRKDTESTHSSNSIEVHNESVAAYEDYIIVDDFIASGTTLREIENAIKNDNKWSIKGDCVGIVLYNDSNDYMSRNINGHTAPIFRIDRNKKGDNDY